MKYIIRTYFLRKLIRRLHLTGFVKRFIFDAGYEESFDRFFHQNLRVGDYVVDCGANIGYYTRKYQSLVGEHGKVFAIEPSVVNFKKLSEIVAENIQFFNVAIGSESGFIEMIQGLDELGATTKVLSENDNKKDSFKVEITTLDSLFLNKRVDVLKIDVEGWELEVIKGGTRVLQNARVVGVEVHSSILETKGVNNPHKVISGLLSDLGFTVIWTDFSHIVGIRN